MLVNVFSKELASQFLSFTQVDAKLSTESRPIHGFLDFGNRTIEFQRGYKNGQFECDTVFFENDYPILYINYSAGVAQSLRLVMNDQPEIFDNANSGERIEGFVDEKGVIEEGNFFNESNRLVYCGMNVNKKHFGFGIEYYDVGEKEIIHYIGFYFNDKYDGIGIEIDQNGSLYRYGIWSEGMFISKRLVISGDIGFNKIHETVIELHVEPTAKVIPDISGAIQHAKRLKRLVINDNSLFQLTSFSLSSLKNLEEIWIGDNVMTGGPLTRDEGNTSIVNRFCLESLPALYHLHIGCRSLYRCQDMIIRNCNQLKHIEIGRIRQVLERNSGSFDWCRSFILSSIHSNINLSIELPSLKTIIIGDFCFRSLHTVMIWGMICMMLVN